MGRAGELQNGRAAWNVRLENRRYKMTNDILDVLNIVS